MAKNKKSFTAYCDWQETFNSLPDDKAGKLIKHLFAYVNDENPETDDLLIKAVFAQIKATLKRDLKKWEKTCEKNRENALLRWNKNNTTASDRMPLDAKHADSDSDSDSDINNNDDFKSQIIKNPNEHATYIEGIYRRKKLKKGSIGKLLKDFNLNLSEQQRNHTNLKDYKINFSNWLNTMERLGKLTDYTV